MDYSLAESSVHGISQTRRLTGVGCHFLLQRIFPTNIQKPSLLCLLHRQADSSPSYHVGNPSYYTAKSLQSCPTLCDPIDSSPPGFPVPGILQARTLEWVAISFSNAWKWKVKSESEVAQSCPTLLDPMDCRLPGSSIHGIFQATVLEWGTFAFSTYYTSHCIFSLYITCFKNLNTEIINIDSTI